MNEPLNITPKRVDETWKAQVDQEHAKLQAAAPTPSATSSQAPSAARPSPQGEGVVSEAAGRVEPSAGDQRFEALLSSLAMEAFIHLGDVPHPSTNRPEPNLQQAKYVIDLLGMLEAKTAGNLSPTESQQLGEYLYQLRMRYVEKTQPPIPPPPGEKGAAR